MSAPNPGRQSPDPAQQAESQGSAPVAAPNDQGAAPSKDHAADASKDQLKDLASNPKHVLEEASEAKTAKQ
ncbi:hypothetical protein K402DRAFT_396396 [Aulographum hederae CBS 113979]|uniref:Uncharacterized protein n=1 Tax=Aulographum hederae CBS 113979 TaxID=1176131 RepID=A0A6G1GSB3_9PEZI|nr:hypothetical protein K402DRAFT_396396 [Aulographum hederae CBS 113979]